MPANLTFSTANWSELPPELLGEISKRLDGQTYLLRFRSVCSSWRSSVVPRPRHPPSRFPFLPNDGISEATWGFHLTKRTVLVLSPPDSDGDRGAWLVKVEDAPAAPGRTARLLNPLSRSQLNPFPEDFPKVIDLSRFRALELGHEFVLHCIHFRPCGNSLSDPSNLYMEKVVLKYLGSESNPDSFVLLTIHVSGRLAMYKSGDKKWTVIRDMPSPYDDVILFRGEFYAVDSTGRAVTVNPCSNMCLASSPVFGGDKKYLVESNGNLLMVDMYLSMVHPGLDSGAEEDERFFDSMGERTVRFKVYTLDQEKKVWIQVKSLGEWALFLGDDCTFSAPAQDLGGFRNCIFFMDNFFYNSEEEGCVFQARDIAVYDMESSVIAPLSDYPERLKLFFPAPDWVFSTASAANPVEPNQVEAQLEEVCVILQS